MLNEHASQTVGPDAWSRTSTLHMFAAVL